MGVRVLICAALLLGACNKVTYVNPGTMPSGQTSAETGWYFVFGLLGSHEVWADRKCPTGVHQVQSKFTFVDLVVTVITFGVITPRAYVIECGR